ncbi:related to Glutaredoxin [Melanopsichium pennsylvanicum]|uniref:Related to Glutaredoxin n=2 Tax=Melanopsichium pennsylvanicum TaxID=63383 RepID=A0AAJ4XSG0_9BASI|nr:related to Glutaredoxin [Melanopsichium pennsylvanicum 4]SNX87498.1 related to Glutaredoxin [Melanopsichium pennsylvanicum]
MRTTESKEHLLHDLELGVATSSRSSSCFRSFCFPPLALFRRKKFLISLLLIPMVYCILLYIGTATSPLESQAGTRMLDALHHASPAINDLAGKIPGIGFSHHYDDAHVDSQGHLHNALLDDLHVEGTPELAALKHKIQHSTLAVASSNNLALQLNEMTKFTPNDESVLLLLLALQSKGYTVDQDWKEIYFDRTPLQAGLFASLNSGPTNRFTQLLAQVGLPKPKLTSSDFTTTTHTFDQATSILDQAHQLYILSRQDWVTKIRQSLGLTVFSKSYCPYSKKAKTLLNSINATYTLYEVDTRPDAHQLQPLLAALTNHKTFPTILVQDRVLGGNDDLHDLDHIHALKPILESVRAL